ncbi:hypothetical protein I308_103834 [Cryptococcus tetragattii IND107]|uniref:Mediator of RNA polymerase II transcription subunit 4 n=1 Tax=Cryptococcus tetragattii IND107 TaxID=1296105 RepID=A0ABR3BRE8_9TREE|nr:hypothetical protein I308_03314 [Cryptococcus tetragattii IND107]
MAQATPRSHPPPYSLLQNLTTQSLLLSHLFTLIASPPNPNTSTQTQLAQVYSALQLSTLDLSGLVREVGQHQEAYRRLVEKKKEVAGLEMRVRGLVKRLEEGRKELEGMIDQGEKSLQDIEKSEREPVPAKTLMAHAQSLSKHSSAPVSSLLAPVDKAQYAPWPTEMSMRMGLLFQLEGSMSGMGERGVVGEEQKAPQKVEGRREHVEHEESGRRYDPNAVFQLDLNSDDSDED